MSSSEHLALQNRKVQLHLVEPTRMFGQVNRDRVRIAPAQSLGKGGGLVGAPVFHDPENASRLSIRSATHHVVDQPPKGLNARLRLNSANHPPRLHIEGSQIRYSTMANVFVFEAHAAARSGRHRR